MDESTFTEMIGKARSTNVKRDGQDRKHGFAAPVDCTYDVQLRTVMSAIEAGMRGDDWTCIAEAYCMAEDLVHEMRSRPVWEQMDRLAARRTAGIVRL